MKKLIHSQDTEVFGMSNITPKRSGLQVSIWSDHGGVNRAVSHRGTPRVKLSVDSYSISVSIEENPRILAPKSASVPANLMKKFKEGIEYVSRNYDLFLKHYLDTTDEFDDLDLFDALKERGQIR